MPGLRFYSPELPIEQKRIMVKELTEAVGRSLNLQEEGRNWTLIHFMPFKLEDFAIGGALMVDTQNPCYYLEITERDLTTEKKEALVRNLTAVLADVFKLAPHELYKINIIFQEYKPEDMARAGKFLSQMGMALT